MVVSSDTSLVAYEPVLTANKKKREFIVHLKEALERAMIACRKRLPNDFLPKRVVYYRNGVNDPSALKVTCITRPATRPH